MTNLVRVSFVIRESNAICLSAFTIFTVGNESTPNFCISGELVVLVSVQSTSLHVILKPFVSFPPNAFLNVDHSGLAFVQ